VIVWSELGHTENSLYAVAPDGSVYKLPADFNLLVRDEGLVLEDARDVLEMLNFYLGFHTDMPGTDRLIVLDSVADVPTSDTAWEDRSVDVTAKRLEPHRGSVKSPVAEPAGDGGWIVRLHTWRRITGNLQRCQIHITDAGEVDVIEIETLEESLGDFVTIE
jgi:hypothetical protein